MSAEFDQAVDEALAIVADDPATPVDQEPDVLDVIAGGFARAVLAAVIVDEIGQSS